MIIWLQESNIVVEPTGKKRAPLICHVLVTCPRPGPWFNSVLFQFYCDSPGNNYDLPEMKPLLL